MVDTKNYILCIGSGLILITGLLFLNHLENYLYIKMIILLLLTADLTLGYELSTINFKRNNKEYILNKIMDKFMRGECRVVCPTENSGRKFIEMYNNRNDANNKMNSELTEAVFEKACHLYNTKRK